MTEAGADDSGRGDARGGKWTMTEEGDDDRTGR